jgi:hypothetical protein
MTIAFTLAIIASGAALWSASRTLAQRLPITAQEPRGLELGLRLPAHSYPRDALVRVWVTITNVTGHSQVLARGCSPRIDAQVIDDRGSVVYPPPFPGGLIRGCLSAPPVRLGPGRSVTRARYVILRARHVRPVVVVNPHKMLAGGQRTVTLTRGTPPHARWTYGPTLSVAVYPATSADRGRPLFMQAVRCGSPSGAPQSASGTLHWTRASAPTHGGYEFDAPCSAPLAWHLVVGWTGQPVASVNYPSRSHRIGRGA